MSKNAVLYPHYPNIYFAWDIWAHEACPFTANGIREGNGFRADGIFLEVFHSFRLVPFLIQSFGVLSLFFPALRWMCHRPKSKVPHGFLDLAGEGGMLALPYLIVFSGVKKYQIF